MLCSNCSERVRPIVAVDIDGTLGDYHGHFLDFAGDYFGLWKPISHEYNGTPSFRDWFLNETNLTVKDWHDVKLAYRQGGMKRTMPIVDGARALCWSIKSGDAELWLTTTRPYLSLDNIVPDTIDWCRRHDIAYDGMLFDEDKYLQLANRVDTRRVVAVLDDLQEMCEAASQILYYGNDAPILISNGYNRTMKWNTIMSLERAASLVARRIDDWKFSE